MKKTTLITIIISLVFLQITKAQSSEPILRLNLEMHNDDILDINTDAKGKYVLTTSIDKTAKLWNAHTGELIRTYRFQIGDKDKGILYAGAISPNTEIVAVGGYSGFSGKQNLYIFNTTTGKLIQKHLLDITITDLEFSNNGEYLAVALGGNRGVVIYKTNLSAISNLSSLKIEKFKTLAGYGKSVQNIAFSPHGKLATASYDEKIRLYNNNFSLIKETTGVGNQPISVAFSPDGNKIAVGYSDVPQIEVRSANNLQLLYKPELEGISKAGAFKYVAFSADGNYLYGGGQYSEYTYSSRYWVYRKWQNQGKGNFLDYREAFLTFSDLKAIPNTHSKGADILTANYTSFGRAEPEAPYNKSTKIGGSLFKKKAQINDFNILGNRLYLRINESGDKIAFKPWYKNNVEFSLKDRKLYETDNTDGMLTYQTNRGAINITNWQKLKNPLMNGSSLPTWSGATCKSVDVADNGKKAIFATLNYVTCYNSNRDIEWEEYSNTDICEINMSGNSKIFITALMNGLINWYKMDDIVSFEIESVTKGGLAEKSGLKAGDIVLSVNGKEFKSGADFSLFIRGKKQYNFKVKRGDDIFTIKMNKTGNLFGFSNLPGKSKKRLLFSLYAHPNNKDWILYSPEGYFDCSQGAENFAGWHINQGENKEAKFYPLSQFYEQFYVPNLGKRLLDGETITSNVKISNIKLPPKVKITSPASDGGLRGFKIVKEKTLKSEQKEITVSVKATDQGGGINEIRLYQNGKLVNTTQRGYKVVEAKGSEQTKTFTLSLTNGKNIIKATAFSNQRTESVPDEITVQYDGVRSSANLYMLVIGIDNYKNPRYKLNYALADAGAFKKQIELGSQTIFGKTEAIYLSDAKASKQGITNAFNQLKLKAKANDVFVFYYAGHGVMSEEEKAQFYIIPYDVTQLYGNNGLLKSKGVSAQELQEFSKNLKAQKQLFVFDACQSGGMVEHLTMRGAAEEKAIAQLARSTGTFWLTASGSEQFATEFAQLGHGLFTYTILQALKGDADGSSKDKKITVKEISSYLNDMVPELSEKYKGSAQYPTSYGFGQDFPVVIVK